MRMLSFAALTVLAAPVSAADPSPLEEFLKKQIIGPRTALVETQEFVDAKVPRLPKPSSAAEWDREAQRIREAVLKNVVFRGAAAKWRDAQTKVEMLDAVKGTEGYTLKKLRYEILPGFWIPALLYEPEKLEGKVPVSLAVNGHDRNGKAADYKQIRCINMAKRGMIVLNVEWLGMGQLNVPGNAHGAMNQLDLCGSSGLAPFYLSMSRGLDILLKHPNADPKRVAVSGLSGGGWQTIFISSLDTRVTLCNPVAGYSSFRTRIEHHKDLGDSEQTPCDLATIADYAHLTAMMAPRPTLLTFNAKDDCCFEAGYALPPLNEGALPFFKLHNAENALRTHINQDPGNHNFGKDNREALYKMLGNFFFAGDKNFKAEEIECAKEVKTKDELNVPLPAENLDINGLARSLAKDLPRPMPSPTKKDKVNDWRKERLQALYRAVRFVEGNDSQTKFLQRYMVTLGQSRLLDGRLLFIDENGITASTYELRLNKHFTVPMIELSKGNRSGTTIVISDGGRPSAAAKIQDLLDAGERVIVVDLWYFGDAKPNPKDWLWALMIDTIGQRPLGLQASQLAAVAKWHPESEKKVRPVDVCAIGPRSSTIALVAAALEPKQISSLELTNPLGSFKEIIDGNRLVQMTPELFCFGLLEQLDVKDIAKLVAPRPIKIVNPSERAKKELAGLKEIYKAMGSDFDPFK